MLAVNEVLCGDCLQVMRQMPDNCIDTIITDPPYGLGFMGANWDTFSDDYQQRMREREAKRRPRKDGRKATGFQEAAYAGGYDYSRNPGYQEWCESWAREALRVAKPGAIMMVFGGTRTHHRLMCAIEDAGWEIRDCLMWLYGSGFPKSHDISKAIDKRAVCPECQGSGEVRKGHAYNKDTKDWDKAWESFKPIYEPCKACKGTGRGRVNVIGKGRAGKTALGQSSGWNKTNNPHEFNITVPTSPEAKLWDGWGTALKPAWEPIIVAMKPLDGTFAENAENHGVAGLWIDGGRVGMESHTVHGKEAGHFQPGSGQTIKDYREVQGRWPANVILDEEAGKMLDEQSGERPSGGSATSQPRTPSIYEDGLKQRLITPRIDSGGASRFFYCAKAPRNERWFYCKICERVFPMVDRGVHKHGKPDREQTHIVGHPTQKPLKLMEYLCRLTKTPTGGLVLDMFFGVGTTGVACINTGRDYIGIDTSTHYCEIARVRLAREKLLVATAKRLGKKYVGIKITRRVAKQRLAQEMLL